MENNQPLVVNDPDLWKALKIPENLPPRTSHENIVFRFQLCLRECSQVMHCHKKIYYCPKNRRIYDRSHS